METYDFEEKTYTDNEVEALDKVGEKEVVYKLAERICELVDQMDYNCLEGYGEGTVTIHRDRSVTVDECSHD